ncbi:MAG: Fic family protein [Deltaproteobacteria bacterium]|nr:Fic family protein [Deltaproteobacteria bacterium]
MIEPKFTFSDLLINNIKKIAIIIAELNNRSFPKTVLATFEQKANSLSAHASTSIEGNPLPLTEVKRLLRSKPENIRATEREVLNYNRILETINERMKKGPIAIDLDFICDVQREVTAALIEKLRWGMMRKEPVFVSDPRSGKTVYWPPDHQDVPKLMRGLIQFVQGKRQHLDPLILAGIFHKAFVIIHPFMDGNGRTARLVTKALLADMGLNTFNLFSFENYYNNNVAAYFRHVGLVGNYYDLANSIDFTPWLEYFTGGIIDELLRVKKELEVETGSPEFTLHSHHKKMLQYIQNNGFITDRDYSKLTRRAKATRSLDFKKMLAMGLIERFGKGRLTHYKRRP